MMLAGFAGRGAVLLLALALAVGCGGGELARDFEAELFDGGRFRLSEAYSDGVVVVNFWYPSCPPCREEMPELERAWGELGGEGVRFLGLFVPRGLDTEFMAREFVGELGLSFDFATDREGVIAAAYGVEYYPATWFIGRGGELAAIHEGAMDADRIVGMVRGLE